MNILTIYVKLILIGIILFQLINCKFVKVKTSSGLVKGKTINVFNRIIEEFLGIPFAEPPIGDLRFAKPKPIDKPLTVSDVKYVTVIIHKMHTSSKFCVFNA